MTNAELVAAMKERVPVILDDPLRGVTHYERIVRIEYSLTEDHYAPTNTSDGITVGAVLGDQTGRSYTTAEPRLIHRYTREEFERRKKVYEG